MVVGLCGDVAMSTDANALNKLLRTIKLIGVNLIIVLRLKKNIDFKLYVYKHINKYIHTYIHNYTYTNTQS